jgi:hypothetical protein
VAAARYDLISNASILSANAIRSAHGSAAPPVATPSRMIARPASGMVAKPRAAKASISVLLPEPGPPVMT